MEDTRRSSWLSGAEVPHSYPPLLQVQHDWPEVCKAKQGSFWVSYKKDAHSNTVHGRVRIIPDTDPMQFDSEEGFKVSVNLQKRKVHIVSPDGHYENDVQTNAYLMEQIHQGKCVSAIDISPAGELAVTGSDDGLVRVWQTKDGVMRRDLQGHVGDINTVQWFPSGQVVLTGSSDYQLKIWDVVKGECGATLKGHAGGVLGTAIIERGRNVISCSRDGTARLWDVSTQNAITIFGDKPFATPSANAVYVGLNPLPVANPTEAAHPKEVGTEGKLLLVAKENAALLGYDIRNRHEIFALRASSALNCCLMTNQHSIVAGAEDGLLIHWDIRNTATPRNILHRSNAAITDITTKRGVEGEATRCWAGTRDGLFFEWDLESQSILTELSGSNFDSLNGIAVYGELAFGVAKEGILKYRLHS